MAKSIMIDLETLGTTADAMIIAIGAVCFDMDAGLVYGGAQGALYRSVSCHGQSGRSVSAGTLQWWMGQSAEAQAVFHEPKVNLALALSDLRSFIAKQDVADITVWSNGADFDLPMLAHAYARPGSLPWAPYAGRCYRTYKNLPGARAIKVERQGLHHNALDDAVYQARHLCAIHQALFCQNGGAA